MENKRGYVALSVIIIISVVVVIIASTSALGSIGEAQSSLAHFTGEKTLNFVEGCVEDGLMKARASSSYSGSTITRPEGICTVTITGASNPRTLQATTTDTKYKRTVEVKYNRTARGISLISWKEIQ